MVRIKTTHAQHINNKLFSLTIPGGQIATRPCLLSSKSVYLQGWSVCKAMSGAWLVQTDLSLRSSRSRSNFRQQKRPPLSEWPFLLYKSLAVTYFHMGPPTLSSALSCFTSEFGMGSGGANSLWPPGINGIS